MIYEEFLWGNIEEIHKRFKRQYDYTNNLIYVFTQYQNLLYYFSKEVNKIVDNHLQLYEEKNSTINNLLQSLMGNLKIQGNKFERKYNEMNEIITTSLKEIMNIINLNENDHYKHYIESKKNYDKSKEKLNNIHKNYINSIQKAEEKTINCIKSKFNNEEKVLIEEKEIEAINYLKKGNNSEKEYLEILKKINNNRMDSNEKQRIYFNYYHYSENEISNMIKNSVLSYINLMKELMLSLLSNLDILTQAIEQVNIDEDTSIFLNKYKSNLKPEEIVEINPYIPKIQLTYNSENPSFDYEIIKLMKSHLNTVYINFIDEEEEKKIELRIILSKLFNDNIVLNDIEKEKLKKSFENESYRNFFLVSLSNQRINNKIIRKKEIIDEMTLLLEELLSFAEKEKDYNNVKSCIILSQTYYYLNKDEKKIYISDQLNVSFFKNINFWEEIIEYEIEKEIEKCKEKNINNNEDLTNQVSTNAFAQLISYTNTMKEFKIDKNQIIQIIKKFIDKFNIQENYAEQIYAIIE